MKTTHVDSLFKKPMTRKEFLGLSVFALASLFGIVGVVEELTSHAATPFLSEEPEVGTITSPASIVTDTTASDGKAVKFGLDNSGSLPTIGPLYQRCSFGAYAGSTTGHASLESAVAGGGKLERYNTYQTMGFNGNSNFPSADASWCLATGHTLDISWDCDATGPTFAVILAGSNNASLDAFFQACKAHGQIIHLRMWWEMNEDGGPTKPVSGNLCTGRAQWIQTWQYVVNRCKLTNGCTNVKFTYCPGGDSNSHGNTIENMYPGSAYVDELGWDVYNNPAWSGDNWQTFDQCQGEADIDGFYNRLASLDPKLPMSIGEIGTVDSSTDGQEHKSDWLAGMFTSTYAYPRIRNINFFNQDPWRIDETGNASVIVCQQYLAKAPING